MRIYLTDLQAYNNGNLVGEWLELPMSKEELQKAIDSVLERGMDSCNSVWYQEGILVQDKHEEYFITDYECEYYDIDEYESLDTLNDLAEKMSNLTEDEQTATKLMLENYIADTIDVAIEHLDDIHNTGQTNMEDIAYNYAQEAVENMPSNMRYYFDYEALGHDMETNGTYLEDSEGYLWEYVA